MGPYNLSKKIFVVITGRDVTSPGIYASWRSASSHIQGIKKISGIIVEWHAFEGAHRETESLLYWHSHYKEPPNYPDLKIQNPASAPAPAPTPTNFTPAKTRSKGSTYQELAHQALPPAQAPAHQAPPPASKQQSQAPPSGF